jgi:DNA-binding response OmpR family regulator
VTAPRLLIVDDDRELNEMVKLSAQQAGFLVVQAFDGGEALACAETHRPDVVLLDINMPVLDGRDVLKSLRANPSTCAVCVVVFSARGDQTDRRVGLELGADDYIEKPFTLKQLMGKLSYVLWKRSQAQTQ